MTRRARLYRLYRRHIHRNGDWIIAVLFCLALPYVMSLQQQSDEAAQDPAAIVATK